MELHYFANICNVIKNRYPTCLVEKYRTPYSHFYFENYNARFVKLFRKKIITTLKC